MNTFLVLSGHPDPERFIPAVFPWMCEAGRPYNEWLFGGPDLARQRVKSLMGLPSSLLSISRATLILTDGTPAGFFVGMGGDELKRCQWVLGLVVLKETEKEERASLAARLKTAQGLAPEVEGDVFFLSGLAVAPEYRGQGLGRALLNEYLATGRRGGFRRFELSVFERNTKAARLYESAGFRVVRRSTVPETDMGFLSMALEESGP